MDTKSNAKTNKEITNEQNEMKIILSISVLEDGRILIIENGKPIENATKIEFLAEVGEVPKYTISKNIKVIAGGNHNE